MSCSKPELRSRGHIPSAITYLKTNMLKKSFGAVKLLENRDRGKLMADPKRSFFTIDFVLRQIQNNFQKNH